MIVRVFPTILSLTLITSMPALAYDGMEKDFSTCTQGSGKVANTQIVKACTRLINNAAAENETVGFFYALRATANTDKKSNCRDARKAIKLLKDPGVVEAAKSLAKSNC